MLDDKAPRKFGSLSPDTQHESFQDAPTGSMASDSNITIAFDDPNCSQPTETTPETVTAVPVNRPIDKAAEHAAVALGASANPSTQAGSSKDDAIDITDDESRLHTPARFVHEGQIVCAANQVSTPPAQPTILATTEDYNDELDTIENWTIDRKQCIVTFAMKRTDGSKRLVPECIVQAQNQDKVLAFWGKFEQPRETTTKCSTYRIFKILDHDFKGKIIRVRVQWVGYLEELATWENASKLLSTLDKDRVKEYLERVPVGPDISRIRELLDKHSKTGVTPSKRRSSAANPPSKRPRAEPTKAAGEKSQTGPASIKHSRPPKKPPVTPTSAPASSPSPAPGPGSTGIVAYDLRPKDKIMGGLSDSDLYPLQPGVSGKQAWLTGRIITSFLKNLALLCDMATFEVVEPGSSDRLLSKDIRKFAETNGAMVAICFNSHWVLVMIWPSRREVGIWDSLRSNKSDKPTEPDRPVIEYVGFNIQRLLGIDPPTFEPSASATASGWKIKWEPCPQQQSDFDCGISVLVAASFYATGHEMPSSLAYDLWRRLLLAIASGNVFSLPKMEELPESLRSLPPKPDIKLIGTHIQGLQDFQARQVARASIVEALPTAISVIKSLKAQVAEKYMQTRFVDLEDLYFRLHNISLDTYSQKLDVPSDSR
ncbi:uncharacterized protein PgNI_12352 [Pyricularia grisea]|uniref:Ubiquitin-like protease family profile domain-containing protein n=1 Tax=Pyricularia grisea TaxID=148305 RepID=A0A6P8AMU1_PYRGI|nr:uncharacterized protein PgNI_12352 [Pyricularia grisea]TLD03334.1 hypothetical protein PgNI_12352 [Pyricularia grisea]